MPIKISLEFSTIAEAVAALSRLDGAAVTTAALDHVTGSVAALWAVAGSPVEPPVPQDAGMDPAAVFGITPVPPLASAAPSTAAADASPTAPAAPPVSAPTPPTAAAPSAPTTAPAATAPSAPAVPTSPADVARDKTGLPWDARIHASTKTTNADGSWRSKRDLDKDFKAKIEAELRAVPGAPVAATAPESGKDWLVPTAAVAALAVATPAAPVPPAAPLPPAAPAGVTFPALMARLAPKFATDPATMSGHMIAALATVGLTSPGQLGAAPHLVQAVSDKIDALMAVPA